MNTGLTTDTLMGVQPTLISEYLIHSSLPEDKCNQVVTPGFLCDYGNKGDIDLESSLRGLDRRITKQEPPKEYLLKSPPITSTSNKSLPTSFQAFEPQNSRSKRSCNTLSGIHINRFEDTFHKPQELTNIIINEPYRGGFQSRINSKECHVEKCGVDLKLSPGYGSNCGFSKP